MRALDRQFLFIAIASALSLHSCKTTPPATVKDVQGVAVEKLGQDIESFPNATGQYILFVQKPTNSPTALKFIVIDTRTREVIEAQSFMPGHVKWVTEDSLEVLNVPGMVKSTETLSSYIKVIHLRRPK